MIFLSHIEGLLRGYIISRKLIKKRFRDNILKQEDELREKSEEVEAKLNGQPQEFYRGKRPVKSMFDFEDDEQTKTYNNYLDKCAKKLSRFIDDWYV